MDIRILSTQDWLEYKDFRLMNLKLAPTAFTASVADELLLMDEDWQQRVQPSRSNLVVAAFVESGIIAAVGLTQAKQEKTQHKTMLWGLYVDAKYRSQGVATKLIKQTLNEFNAIPELDQIQVAVNTRNTKAIALYQKFGFNQYGIEIDAIRVNGITYDEMKMAMWKIKID